MDQEAKDKANRMLDKFFKTEGEEITKDFLEEKELLENLLYQFYIRNSCNNLSSTTYRDIIEESIKEALACKNTQNIVNSNLKMIKSNEKNTQNLVNSNLKMIESNEKLSKSNEKYQKSLNWLTLALVIVGLIQIGVQIRKN